MPIYDTYLCAPKTSLRVVVLLHVCSYVSYVCLYRFARCPFPITTLNCCTIFWFSFRTSTSLLFLHWSSAILLFKCSTVIFSSYIARRMFSLCLYFSLSLSICVPCHTIFYFHIVFVLWQADQNTHTINIPHLHLL